MLKKKIKFNSKQIIILALIALTIAIINTSGLAANNKAESTPIEKAETINMDANYILFNDVNQLDQAADLILVGSPTMDFPEREHITTYFGDGAIQDFYTLTDLKIDKILKGPQDFNLATSQSLKIIEPIGYAKPEKKENKITREEYSELEKGEKYIIFLMQNDQGQYVVINVNNGKFNLNETEVSFASDSENVKHEKIKKEVFSKYKIKE
ncbi:hypothetical protein NSS79_02845 [Paenibacillus sp. FSL L8-0436]|uniref:hypothetical protein n=1 Tax=Paenibacillus sp. FSL L8-0436 TaxID=2954686 RepID=UPI0031584D1B